MPITRGIVHTAEFYQKVLIVEGNRFKDCYRNFITHEKKNMTMFDFGDGIKVALFDANGFMRLQVDFIELLRDPAVDEKDLNVINERIHEIGEGLFQYEDKRFILTRHDIRFDVQFDDKKAVDTMIRLLDKSIVKIGRMYKDENPDYYGKSLRYKSAAERSTMAINIYDKEQEIRDKARQKADIPDIEEYEKNVLRFEVQIKNPHLNYHKRYYGTEKELENYLDTMKSKDYFHKYIYPIAFSGDYYDLKSVKKLLKENGLKESERKKLVEFLKYASKTDMTKAKDKFGRYKYETYTNKLNSMGINPILIPKRMGINHFSNPLSECFGNSNPS